MVLSMTAFYKRIYLRSLTFQEFPVFFLLDNGFWIASKPDFFRVIVFLSIICPRIFTRVRKKKIYPGLLSCFRVVMIFSDDIFLRQ